MDLLRLGRHPGRAEREKLNLIMVKDLDPALDYYSPVIITSEKLAKGDKTLVKSFMKAAAQGYTFAIKHPEQAADILIQDVPDTNKGLVRASQKWLSTKYQDDAAEWGYRRKKCGAVIWTSFMTIKSLRKNQHQGSLHKRISSKPAMTYLQLEGITKTFGGKKVLDGISATIQKGEFCAFIE